MPVWPELPAAGELVRLPLPMPPVLCGAAGYTGSARYLALYWTPYGDELVFSDGEVTATGWWPAWIALCSHELGRAVLGPYELGSSETQARHWLLADRWEQTLDVGLAFDIGQLLATQPSELAAAAEVLGAERTLEMIEDRLRNAPVPDIADIATELERTQKLVDELVAWLDEQLEEMRRV